MIERPRRLRSSAAMRRLVRETHLVPSQLILPMFVAEGIDEPRPIASMPGVVQHSRESARRAETVGESHLVKSSGASAGGGRRGILGGMSGKGGPDE